MYVYNCSRRLIAQHRYTSKASPRSGVIMVEDATCSGRRPAKMPNGVVEKRRPLSSPPAAAAGVHGDDTGAGLAACRSDTANGDDGDAFAVHV